MLSKIRKIANDQVKRHETFIRNGGTDNQFFSDPEESRIANMLITLYLETAD